MLSISSEYFDGQLQNTAAAFVKLAVYDETLYNARAKHDLQPLSKNRPTLSKPQDRPFAKRQTRANVSMSHLVDKKKLHAHVRERSDTKYTKYSLF